MQREYCGSAAARAQSRPVEIRPRAGRDSAAIRLPTDTTAAREREESSEVVCLEELTRCQLIVYDACCKLRPLVFYIVQGGARGARLHVRTSVLTKSSTLYSTACRRASTLSARVADPSVQIARRR